MKIQKSASNEFCRTTKADCPSEASEGDDPKVEALIRDLMLGMADLEAGRYKVYASGQELFDDIKKNGRERVVRRTSS
jgi:hypothetical protein